MNETSVSMPIYYFLVAYLHVNVKVSCSDTDVVLF